MKELADRIDGLNWDSLYSMLDSNGFALTPPLLTSDECREIEGMYDDARYFRSRIHMARHQFGMGEYQYFRDPLPRIIQTLRELYYPYLARIANEWYQKTGKGSHFPSELASLLEVCRQQGQMRPTPLILRYDTGGYNCLHQDLYGEISFPFQVVLLLSQPDVDFTGGEFLLVEQRPRAQSRGHVITLQMGQALIFPTRQRPVQGTKGYHHVTLRHGVSTITAGIRYALGIIFHNAT